MQLKFACTIVTHRAKAVDGVMLKITIVAHYFAKLFLFLLALQNV